MELPVILPERVAGAKMLVELAPQEASSGATDFSGDFGVVGRASTCLRKGSENSILQFDLKGVLYDGVRMPIAGTLLLLSLGTAEAKVEGLLDEYVQLRYAGCTYIYILFLFSGRFLIRCLLNLVQGGCPRWPIA